MIIDHASSDDKIQHDITTNITCLNKSIEINR